MSDPALLKAAFRRLEFHLTYTCPQACVFCSEEDRMTSFRDYPVAFEEAARILLLKRREGFDHVTFTGGEPTIYPRFERLLQLARRVRYKTYITTYGGALVSEAGARRLLPHLDEVCFSLHGPDAAIHDRAVGEKGSFTAIRRAMRNLETLPWTPYVLINFVATKANVASMVETLEFAARHKKVRHFLVSNMASEGGGKHRYRELAAPLSAIGARAPALARAAEKHGLVLRFFGVPACVLGRGLESLANDFHWSPRATVERARDERGRVGMVEIRGWTPTRGRVQTEKCAPCVYRALCPGVFSRYRDEYGDAELSPILEGGPSTGLGRGMPLVDDEKTAFWPLPEAR